MNIDDDRQNPVQLTRTGFERAHSKLMVLRFKFHEAGDERAMCAFADLVGSCQTEAPFDHGQKLNHPRDSYSSNP